MLSQQFQQPEPPNKANTFMEKFGLPALLVIFTIIATIIGTVLLGKIQVLDFNWLVLLSVLALVLITISFGWYSVKTRRVLQKKYQENMAAMNKDVQDFKNEMRQMITDEIRRSNDWKITFSQAIAKEQKERLEELKKQLTEQIGDVNTSLSTGTKNNYTHFADWTTAHANAHREEQKLYKHQLKALEEKLTDKQVSESDN